MWKKLVKDYFTFTKKERAAVMVLVFIMVSVSIFPYCFPPAEDKVDELAWRQFIDEAARLNPPLHEESKPPGILAPDGKKTSNAGGKTTWTLFPFDPNTLPAAGWKKLGLREGTIRTILNYIAKGGRFNQATDIGKIYGLRKEEIERLQPWVRIAEKPPDQRRRQFTPPRTAFGKDSLYKPGQRRLTAIDINEADTAAWIRFPGIGPKLASRIVQFRSKLGGFNSVDQVGETFGLPDSVYQKIKPWLHAGAKKPVTININTAGVDELRQHPYVRWQLAKAIVRYREQHGPFHATKDLERIAIMDPAQLLKLQPYLVVE